MATDHFRCRRKQKEKYMKSESEKYMNPSESDCLASQVWIGSVSQTFIFFLTCPGQSHTLYALLFYTDHG